jgi:hypothetical protein
VENVWADLIEVVNGISLQPAAPVTRQINDGMDEALETKKASLVGGQNGRVKRCDLLANRRWQKARLQTFLGKFPEGTS